ncbi:MAG: hypothetical protein GXP16_12065 [Gammaproteobacteria bacterium]|nr:hypothetical protein [Gammaproteobacteria bacterium]
MSSELLRVVRPWLPWLLGVIVAAIGAAISAGWIQVPVKAQTVAAIEKMVKLNTEKLSLIETEQRSLIVDRAVRSEQLENIEEKVNGFDDKLDTIMRYVIQRNGRL